MRQALYYLLEWTFFSLASPEHSHLIMLYSYLNYQGINSVCHMVDTQIFFKWMSKGYVLDLSQRIGNQWKVSVWVWSYPRLDKICQLSRSCHPEVHGSHLFLYFFPSSLGRKRANYPPSHKIMINSLLWWPVTGLIYVKTIKKVKLLIVNKYQFLIIGY